MATALHLMPRVAPLAPGPLDEALWYACTLGWPVLADAGSGGPPAGPATDRALIQQMWAASESARVLLATGVHFDVLDVPGRAGTRALRRAQRLGLPLGPVAATRSGRLQFLVAPGIADDLPALLDWLDWAGIDLDLRAHGEGDTVAAPSPWPATWLAPWPRSWESARWLHAPVNTSAPLLRVDVRLPDVTRLIGTLAHACQHVRLFPRPRMAAGH